MAKFQQVEINPTVGRGLIATESISQGEIIFEESPVVLCQFSWNKCYGYAACDYCMRPLETVLQNVTRLLSATGDNADLVKSLTLPDVDCCYFHTNPSPAVRVPVSCPHCYLDKYCSNDCLQLAWSKYHSLLCTGGGNETAGVNPLNELIEFWKSIHYPPETSSIMLPLRILAMIACAEPTGERPKLLQDLNNFCHEVVVGSGEKSNQWALKLIGKEHLEHIEQLRILTEKVLTHQINKQIQSGLSSHFVASATECLHQWIQPNGFQLLMSLVARNAQGIATSPLAMWVKAMKRTLQLETDQSKLKEFNASLTALYDALEQSVGTAFLDNEGSGLYKVESILNHSCSPNAQICFEGSSSHLKVMALQTIHPGEQICIDYIRARESPSDELYSDQLNGSTSWDCDEEKCMSRSRRQRALREYYLFHCQCSLCIAEADQPSESSEEEDEDEEDDEEMDT